MCPKATFYHSRSKFPYKGGEIEQNLFKNQSLIRKTHGNNRQVSDPAIFSSFPLFGSYPYDFLK